MKKNNGYMTRALRSKDPRFAPILSKLGYTALGDELPEVSMDLKKDELLAIAEKEGVEVDSDDTKADIIAKIEAART